MEPIKNKAAWTDTVTSEYVSFKINNNRYVGCYDIMPDEFTVYLKRKPNFIHRWFTRILLGWRWYDIPNKNK